MPPTDAADPQDTGSGSSQRQTSDSMKADTAQDEEPELFVTDDSSDTNPGASLGTDPAGEGNKRDTTESTSSSGSKDTPSSEAPVSSSHSSSVPETTEPVTPPPAEPDDSVPANTESGWGEIT